MRRAIGITAVTVIALAVSGCGLFGEDVPPTPGSFSACLSATGYSSSTDPDDVDPIARAAGVGAVWAEIGTNQVVVVFERSDDDARRTEEAYDSSAGGTADGEQADTVTRDGSVVLHWESPPSAADATVVDDCLVP